MKTGRTITVQVCLPVKALSHMQTLVQDGQANSVSDLGRQAILSYLREVAA